MYYNKWVVLQPNSMLVLNGKQRFGLNLSIIAALKIVKHTWVINHCVPAQRNVACIPNARFVKWLFTFTDSLAWINDDVATDLPSTHRDVHVSHHQHKHLVTKNVFKYISPTLYVTKQAYLTN